ncbi:Protein of unknown function [Porphyromonadaceae bacterium KH3CP3RA]|nr:Protein of unknown function [Porphyromonadaceae bacterium KH3CP3RA]
MIRQNILYILIAAWLTGILAGCESFQEADKADDIAPLSVEINITSEVYETSGEGLTLTLTEINKGTVSEKSVTGLTMSVDNVLPGIYNLSVFGATEDTEGNNIYLNGEQTNYPIIEDNKKIEVDMKGSLLGPVIFKELFYSGTANFYFRNQFYEIYNNSEETVYLDGVHFADLYPTNATTVRPVWREQDKGDYVYGARIWKFPGNGTDYPLAPGESCVISQFAANHKLPQYNPNSPIDGSSSEFEFNMDNPNYPDQPAPDMVHVFYDGKAGKGGMPQYLTPVFGGAFVLFKPLEGETYDPVNDRSLQALDQDDYFAQIYAKIPYSYIWDAVEAGPNESEINGKRVPGVLDAGMTYVGDIYNSLGVARKKRGERPDGTPLLQDTNNSTNDFERGVTPQFRRYGSKMPVWNHTLTGK